MKVFFYIRLQNGWQLRDFDQKKFNMFWCIHSHLKISLLLVFWLRNIKEQKESQIGVNYWKHLTSNISEPWCNPPCNQLQWFAGVPGRSVATCVSFQCQVSSFFTKAYLLEGVGSLSQLYFLEAITYKHRNWQQYWSQWCTKKSYTSLGWLETITDNFCWFV